MWEPLQFEFMRNALLAGVMVSIACGIIGSLVVVNRIVFISGGIAHAAYGGIGLAFFAGFSPTLGAGIFAFGSSMIMAAVSFKNRHRADTIIGVLWAVGMALGIILIDITPGYSVDLMSYLFGSILTVPKSDIWFMILMDMVMPMMDGSEATRRIMELGKPVNIIALTSFHEQDLVQQALKAEMIRRHEARNSEYVEDGKLIEKPLQGDTTVDRRNRPWPGYHTEHYHIDVCH